MRCRNLTLLPILFGAFSQIAAAAPPTLEQVRHLHDAGAFAHVLNHRNSASQPARTVLFRRIPPREEPTSSLTVKENWEPVLIEMGPIQNVTLASLVREGKPESSYSTYGTYFTGTLTLADTKLASTRIAYSIRMPIASTGRDEPEGWREFSPFTKTYPSPALCLLPEGIDDKTVIAKFPWTLCLPENWITHLSPKLNQDLLNGIDENSDPIDLALTIAALGLDKARSVGLDPILSLSKGDLYSRALVASTFLRQDPNKIKEITDFVKSSKSIDEVYPIAFAFACRIRHRSYGDEYYPFWSAVKAWSKKNRAISSELRDLILWAEEDYIRPKP